MRAVIHHSVQEGVMDVADARLPDRWLLDRRLGRLSDAAYRLFFQGLIWSVSNRTEGVLGDDDFDLIPTVDPTRTEELAKWKLWERVNDTWVILDFDLTQTSKAQHEALDNIRRREREKKARQRAR